MEQKAKGDRLSRTDRELVIAFKQGDDHAYDEIYRRHSPRIRVVCSRRLSHDHDAEEALQETFLRAYQALPRFNGQYKLGPWLNRIAINVCIDELRTRARGEFARRLEESDLEAEGGPEEAIAARRPEVVNALLELKPLHAQALKLQIVDGLSHQELAGALSMSPAQVKALLHRARLSFRRVLKNASGWLAGPFVTLRRNRGHEAIPVGGGAVQTMGFLATIQASLPTAERVLTGTVAAALALSAGVANETPQRDAAREPTAGVVTERLDRTLPTGSAATVEPPARTQSETTAVDRAVTLPVSLDAVDRATRETTEHVKQKLVKHKKNDDDVVTRPTAIDARKVERRAKRELVGAHDAAAEAAEELLLTD